MPSANRSLESAPPYSTADLKTLRRDILLYAKSFPPGSERNQRRQVALSLRRLFKNPKWFDAYAVGG